MKKYLGIKINEDRDKLLSEQAKKLLKDYYCREDETSPQIAFARAAHAYSFDDKGLAQRIYDYASKGWFMYSSPVLSNAPLPKEKVKALLIKLMNEKFKFFLENIGVLNKIEFDIEEVGETQMGRWGKCKLLTVGFGHGIATTLLQLTKGYSIISNGGFDVSPTLIKKNNYEKTNYIFNIRFFCFIYNEFFI